MLLYGVEVWGCCRQVGPLEQVHAQMQVAGQLEDFFLAWGLGENTYWWLCKLNVDTSTNVES